MQSSKSMQALWGYLMSLHPRYLYPMRDYAIRTTATLTKSGGATDIDSGIANDLFIAGPGVGKIWTVYEIRLTINHSTTRPTRPDYWLKTAAALTNGMIFRKGTGSTSIYQLHTDAIKDNAALRYAFHQWIGDLMGTSPFTTADFICCAKWTHLKAGAAITLVGDDTEEIQCLVQDAMPGTSDMYADVYYEEKGR